MRMLNKAIEDAADFQEFRDRLCQTTSRDQGQDIDPPVSQRKLGENRATYRARIKAERRATKVNA